MFEAEGAAMLLLLLVVLTLKGSLAHFAFGLDAAKFLAPLTIAMLGAVRQP